MKARTHTRDNEIVRVEGREIRSQTIHGQRDDQLDMEG